jgi:HNH endonuclease
MINFCVLCLNDNLSLTDEHIFPESAGGRIKKCILCKTCNDKAGNYIDAPYLDMKHVQLARAILQIPSKKSGYIPIPLNDTYATNGINGLFKVKLDSNFQPIAVPQAPLVHINASGELNISLSRDVKYARDISKIIRTTLSRFFRSKEGGILGWSAQEQEDAILKIIESAKKVPPTEERVQFPIEGNWELSLSPSYAEYVKIIYEICCIESEGTFPTTASGQKIRNFLMERITGKSASEFDVKEAALALNVHPGIPEDLKSLFEKITDKQLNSYHFALVGASSVVVYMFGFGASFHSSDFFRIDKKTTKVYLNKINGGKFGIYDLEELIQ